MAQPGGPKRDVENAYPTKRACECDRPIPERGVCVKCGHVLPGSLGEQALLADLLNSLVDR